MDDGYGNGNNRTSLVKGAKDIAKEAKRHAAKKVGKVVDRATDEYSSQRNYSRFENEDDDRAAAPADDADDGASSDATEGHDDEDEIYEGEIGRAHV